MRLRHAAFATVLFLACGAPDEGPSVREPIEEQSLEGKVCPGAERVQGIDVSYYQPNIDWNAVKGAGQEFAIIRVSDGLNTIDTKFESHWAGAKAAGLIRSAYQFFRPTQDPTAQANLLLSKIGNQIEPGDLPPVIDMEAAGGLSPAQVTAAMQEWISVVEGKLGRKPIIYTGNYFWTGAMGNPQGYADYPLWIAAYPYCYDSIKSGSYCPTIPDQWSKWAFWQYSDGKNTPDQGCSTEPPVMPGVGQSCDRNFFNGTLADLKAFAAAGSTAGPEFKATFVAQSYPFASETIPSIVGKLHTGYIDLKNAGTKPWSPGKTFLAPMPRDASSSFVAPGWSSPTRVSTVDKEIAPGEVGRFTWDLLPSAPGEFAPYFGLVQEGVTWFADPPLGGGPADDVIQLKLSVQPDPGAGGSGGSDAGAGGSDGGSGGTAGEAGSGGAAGSAGDGGSAGSTIGQDPGASGQAGSGGSGAGKGGAGEAGGGDDGPSVTVENTPSAADEGCGCRAVGGATGRGEALWMMAATVLLRRRRHGSASRRAD